MFFKVWKVTLSLSLPKGILHLSYTVHNITYFLHYWPSFTVQLPQE